MGVETWADVVAGALVVVRLYYLPAERKPKQTRPRPTHSLAPTRRIAHAPMAVDASLQGPWRLLAGLVLTGSMLPQ